METQGSNDKVYGASVSVTLRALAEILGLTGEIKSVANEPWHDAVAITVRGDSDHYPEVFPSVNPNPSYIQCSMDYILPDYRRIKFSLFCDGKEYPQTTKSTDEDLERKVALIKKVAEKVRYSDYYEAKIRAFLTILD